MSTTDRTAALLGFMAVFMLLCAGAQGQEGAPEIDNAVVLMYHHVDAQTPPSTSVSPATFEAHLDYLQANHVVMPLPDIIKALQKGQALPDKAVAITFDDGYRNIYTNGHPLLLARGMPYTVFVNPSRIGQSEQLSWDDIAIMQTQGAHFANHNMTHAHLLQRQGEESTDDWMNRVLADIDEAEAILTERLGYSLKYLAYPFGEFNRHLKAAIEGKGYIGFGQHSGAMSSMSDFGALPRFPAAGVYANLNTLKVKLNSLAMDVTDTNAFTHELDAPLGRVEFNITGDDPRLTQLTCFLNGERVDARVDGPLVTLDLRETLTVGRSRINCTAPSRQLRGRYYWYSHPWVVANAEDVYLN